ncbi:hypothetical protein Ancab_036959 [Ancistrocladus abbreviatus]
MTHVEEDEEVLFRRLKESAESDPDDPINQFNLGLFLWERGREWREKAAEHFVLAAKLNPQNGQAFRYLGEYYSTVETQRALKCYQRAISLNSDDSYSGDALCDLLDSEGKESLEVAVCREASQKSSRAFWAFRRLGYLLVNQKKWSEAIQSLQHAIRGFPFSADLWEALGLAYQRLGMYTAAIKSYGRAMELEDSRVFAMIESGNIFLMLGSSRKGIEQFQQALKLCPENVSARYGLASGLLALSKECINTGAFVWAASLLEEASEIVKSCTLSAGNISCIWKLYGDIQLTYAKCFPWMEEGRMIENDKEAFTTSLLSWKRTCYLAAVCASNSYQRALHLMPWLANVYTDVAIAMDMICALKESCKSDSNSWQLPEKMSLGSLLLEGDNHEFWMALGCLSGHKALKHHAFIRGLQLDVSLAVAWAYLGKLYRELGDKQLARLAFDRARSIDPSLALPWAGMSADVPTRESVSDEAYESCLRAVQIMPLAEFQIGLASLAAVSGHLSSSQVFGAIRQAVQRAPYYPEAHNLNGLVSEARLFYPSAIASFRLARCLMKSSTCTTPRSVLTDISINLARVLSKMGNALDAVRELEDLKGEGLIDVEGLQIYAISLWQLGKNELALSAARDLAKLVSAMGESAGPSVSLICKLFYCISGLDSAVNSILKMPKALFQSTEVSFIILAVHALDQNNCLESVVSSSGSCLSSHEEIMEMHLLIAMSKLVKQGSIDFIDMQSGVGHLKKALHMYPNSTSIRNLLGYFLLSSKQWDSIHVANRCHGIVPYDSLNKGGLRSGPEIYGAEAVACHAISGYNLNHSFPTCKYHGKSRALSIWQMQRSLHQEPWNTDAKYLLILNLLQQAREERYPQHLLTVLKRMIFSSLSSCLYLEENTSYQYQKFQLLLCASEISLQCGDLMTSVSNAKDASKLLLPDSHMFFAHLQLCRVHAAADNYINLKEEYMRCLNLQTDYPVGWMCLKFIESRYDLQDEVNSFYEGFRGCVNGSEGSQNMWMAVYNLLLGLISAWAEDLVNAEELTGKACSLVGTESCLFLCHGAICLELARKQRPEYLYSAVRSLRKAQEVSSISLPFVSLLLAQAEGSLGSKEKWEKNLRLESSTWSAVMKPAEIYFQMYLLAKQSTDGSQPSSSADGNEIPQRWILKAIHLNPSCSRYWKALLNYVDWNAEM